MMITKMRKGRLEKRHNLFGHISDGEFLQGHFQFKDFLASITSNRMWHC